MNLVGRDGVVQSTPLHIAQGTPKLDALLADTDDSWIDEEQPWVDYETDEAPIHIPYFHDPEAVIEPITVSRLIAFLQQFRGDESVYIAHGDTFLSAVSASSTENTVTIEAD